MSCYSFHSVDCFTSLLSHDRRTRAQQPLAPPQKINAASVGPLSEGSGLSEPAEPKSSYYYAHRRKIDFHIPTPTPQRLEPVSAD